MKSTHFLLIFSCMICYTSYAEGARILGVFPMQGRSHFIMFKEIMEALADAGHQVDVISHFSQKKPYPNYTDIVKLEGSLPIIVNNLTYDILQHLSGSSFETLIQLTGTEVCELLELPELNNFIKNPPNNPPYDLVIVEHFYANCYFAFGRHLKAPLVAVTSASITIHGNEPLGNPLNTAIVPEISDRPAFSMNFWQRFTNTIFVTFASIQSRYYINVQNDIVKKQFGPEMPDVVDLERDICLMLTNSHQIFHGVRPFTPAVVEIAGIHIHDSGASVPEDLKKWLDDSKDGFIYFSFGSMVMLESFPKPIIANLYAAFVKIAPVRILLKLTNPKLLPPGLPANVKTLTWVPQVQVLKHKNIRGFITHGGLMGLQEAVAFAVPLIGIPLFGDQKGNIDILANRGVAIALDYKNLSTDNFFQAMNALARDPSYQKRMDALSKQFMDRTLKPRDAAVFWIEYILKHGPDALRSPAVDLTWWQLALLDIYGSILALALTVLYVLKLLFSAIFSRILSTKAALQSPKKIN